jgi:hypothetical protein
VRRTVVGLKPLLDGRAAVGLGDQLTCQTLEVTELVINEYGEQMLTTREVPVQRPSPDASSAGHVVEGGVDPVRGEYVVARLNERVVVTPGISASRGRPR